MNKWIAYYAPADSNHESKRGFQYEEEAWAYVATQLCENCKKELRNHYSSHLDNNGEPSLVEHPEDTSCGCEWYVLTEEDFDKAEGFDGILEAAGWKKIWDKEEDQNAT